MLRGPSSSACLLLLLFVPSTPSLSTWPGAPQAQARPPCATRGTIVLLLSVPKHHQLCVAPHAYGCPRRLATAAHGVAERRRKGGARVYVGKQGGGLAMLSATRWRILRSPGWSHALPATMPRIRTIRLCGPHDRWERQPAAARCGLRGGHPVGTFWHSEWLAERWHRAPDGSPCVRVSGGGGGLGLHALSLPQDLACMPTPPGRPSRPPCRLHCGSLTAGRRPPGASAGRLLHAPRLGGGPINAT